VRVLALTRYGRLGASSRLRIYQYSPALRSLGIDVEVSPLLSDDYLTRLYSKQAQSWPRILGNYLSRLQKLFGARKFDLLWIEKELFPHLPASFERLLAAVGIRYVVDYDDAIFHNYDLSTNFLKRALRTKIDTIMRGSMLVMTGNSYLADRARQAGADRVEIVPTVIDLEHYRTPPVGEHDHLVVGWIGSPATVKYLEAVAPAMRRLAAEMPLQLRVVGAHFESPGLDVVCEIWTEASEVRQISGFDIGIMPLSDSPWERGKCGYKLIQYMACGLSVVASPVGVNEQIVQHGDNGFLAATEDEWLAALRNLGADRRLRKRMGQNARWVAENKYSMQVTAPRVAGMLREAAGMGPR
jgi:glycosyltransferase involved in cell wall biosynthesis